LKVRDIELGGITQIEGQTAERASRQLWDHCWEGEQELGQDDIPFVVVLPNDKLRWYIVPGDNDCDPTENTIDFVHKN